MNPSSKASSASTENKDLKFILSALASAADFKPDWKIVAEEIGIAHSRNAAAKFRDLVKKYGYKLEGKGLTRLEEESDNDQKDDTEPAPPTPMKAGKAKSVKITPKKRKVKKESLDDDEESGAVGDKGVKIEDDDEV